MKGGKKTRQTEEEVGRPHQGMDRPGVRQVPEGSGEQGGKKRGNWLRNRLLCPSDPHGGGIDDDDDDDDDPVLVGRALFPYLGLLLAPWRLLGWPFPRACQDFLGRFDESFPACAFFPFLFKRRTAHARQFHSLGQDQSILAQRS